MRGYEVAERAMDDVKALAEANAIAFGALMYISDDARYYERCKEVAGKALADIQECWERR